MNIGIVGSGKIGGVVGKLWARAGHKVRFSSLIRRRLRKLVADAGTNASRGTIEDALDFGETILVSIPYGSLDWSRKLSFRRRARERPHNNWIKAGVPDETCGHFERFSVVTR